MQILGITGAIGHGKTSLAKAFLRQIKHSQFAESRTLVSEVAEHLNAHYADIKPTLKDIGSVNAWLSIMPDAIRQVTDYGGKIAPIHLNDPQTLVDNQDFQKLGQYLAIVQQNHSLITEKITVDNKEAYRPLLQWIGSYVTRSVDPSLWYRKLIEEARAAEKNGCQLFIIGGVRFPSDGQVVHDAGGKVIAIERPNTPHQDATDPTEAYLSLVTRDTTVINDGLLGALDHIVITIWQDLQTDELKPRYQASRAAFGGAAEPTIKARGML